MAVNEWLQQCQLGHLTQRFEACDIGNMFPQVKSEHIKKHCIIMSASEMLAFASYFGILVGDLVPEDDPFWNFYELLLKILNILLSRTISLNTVSLLQELIAEHNSLYLQLFQDTLKPKFHFLLHYPRIILRTGPPRLIWSMRYEAFHKILKTTANRVTSRKNILLTMAKKQQLSFSYKILSQKGYVKSQELGPEGESVVLLLEKLGPLSEFKSKNSDDFRSVSWAKVTNILYKIGFVLQINKDDSDPSDDIKFGKIKYVISYDDQVYFALILLETLAFHSHLYAYEVCSDNMENIVICSLNTLSNKWPYNIHVMGDGTQVISVMN